MGDAKNVIRSGRISSINPKNGTARVVFADKDNLVSYDLPVLQRSTLKNKDYGMPDVGESVVSSRRTVSLWATRGWFMMCTFSLNVASIA